MMSARGLCQFFIAWHIRDPAAEIDLALHDFGAVVSVKKVLVVDDSATMRRMIIASLMPIGELSFDQAVSGLEAIERMTLSPVDLVMLDLNMPDVHGIEVLRFIRGHENLRTLPVVVLTTRGDEDSKAMAIREGATLYLTKPFAPGLIAEQVRPLLAAGA
jgi:two-component system chemotaxis response regulator CheY